MAKKDRLTRVAVKLGAAAGKANRKAHQLADASTVAREELHTISKQIEQLKKQLVKTTKRLQKSLS